MNLKQKFLMVHDLLSTENISIVLIGGMALCEHGAFRATINMDFLIHENNIKQAKNITR